MAAPRHSPVPQHAPGARPIHAYRYDRKKVGVFLVLLAGLFLFGLSRLLGDGPASGPLAGEGEAGLGSLIAGLFLMAIAGFVMVDLLRNLSRPGPAVAIEEGGLRDLRHGETFIAWEDVLAASIKRRLLARTVKVEAGDGRVLEIDTNLLDVSAPDLLQVIAEQARRASEAPAGDDEEDDETADR